MVVPVQMLLVVLLVGVPIVYVEFLAAFSILGRIVKNGTMRTSAASAGIMLGTVLALSAIAITALLVGLPASRPSLPMLVLAGFGSVAVYWTVGTITIRRFYGLETMQALLAFLAIWFSIGFVNSILSAAIRLIGMSIGLM